MLISLLLALALCITALILAFQNFQPVGISFLVWHFYGSLSLVLAAVFAVGLLSGILLMLPGRIRAALGKASSKRELKAFKKKMGE